ncbi:MAG: NifB/NifX family molybdenum-iron cluster-binding protein [Thermoplasmatota archaeon]
MKVAISSSGTNKEASVDERFARCPYFVIVDTDEMEFETVENTHTSKAHGVGPQVVQMLSEMNIDAVITGNVGPNAHRTLSSADIEVYKATGKVSEAVQKLKDGKLKNLEGKTVQGHFGKGGRR